MHGKFSIIKTNYSDILKSYLQKSCTPTQNINNACRKTSSDEVCHLAEPPPIIWTLKT